MPPTVDEEDSRCWQVRRRSAKDCLRCGQPCVDADGYYLWNHYHCLWWCLECGRRYLRIHASDVPHVYRSEYKRNVDAYARAQEIAGALRAHIAQVH